MNPCTEKGCSGSRKFFHSACDEEVANPVLDVWSWRWASIDNKPTQSGLAETFSIFVRLPSSALNDVLRHSGWNGIFIEPRPASKQGPHPDFSVVWLLRSMPNLRPRSTRTRKHVLGGPASSSHQVGLNPRDHKDPDPWLIVDPWKAYVPTNSGV